MNFLIATNSNFMRPAAVLVYSLCKSHIDTEIDLYVAYHDLTESDLTLLEKIMTSFPHKKLHRIYLGTDFVKRIPKVDQFSYETFYRILALERLPEDLDRILYLDCDMLVKGSLQEVYESKLNDECPFKVCQDIIAYRSNAFDEIRRRAGVPEGNTYFNAGFLLINLRYVRAHRSVGYITDAFVREYNYYPYHDQDILNHMYYNKVEFVPWQLYNAVPGHFFLDTYDFSYGRVRFATYQEINNGLVKSNRFVQLAPQLSENAKIIHYIGFLKPWKYTRDTIYRDLVPFTDYWYDAEIELSEMLKNQDHPAGQF